MVSFDKRQVRPSMDGEEGGVLTQKGGTRDEYEGQAQTEKQWTFA